MLQEVARTGQAGVYVRSRSTHWEITVAARDTQGLLLRIAGALVRVGLSILTAKIYTLGGGKAVDRFWVAIPADGETTAESLRDRLSRELESGAPMGRAELQALRERHRMRSRAQVDTGTEPKVLISNEISDAFTVVDVTCRDRIGTLFQVALVLSEMGLDVHGAVLTTEADKATESIYVTETRSGKLLDASRCAEVAAALERELASA